MSYELELMQKMIYCREFTKVMHFEGIHSSCNLPLNRLSSPDFIQHLSRDFQSSLPKQSQHPKSSESEFSSSKRGGAKWGSKPQKIKRRVKQTTKYVNLVLGEFVSYRFGVLTYRQIPSNCLGPGLIFWAAQIFTKQSTWEDQAPISAISDLPNEY